MADEDYILDISNLGPPRTGEPVPTPTASPAGDAPGGGRPFISIHFECCNVYQRIYRNAAGTAYVGWCPKCSRKVVAEIGPGGVSGRFFRAT